MKTQQKTEFGDFQTPTILAKEVCLLLAGQGFHPQHVVEPTCGEGNFLSQATTIFPEARLHGFEINAEKLVTARQRLSNSLAAGRLSLQQADFFTFDWPALFARLPGDILLLGNPPWVTSAGVSTVNGSNLPPKTNFQGLRGLAAKTGRANFDISEWMLIRLIEMLRGRDATLAFLCKTSTARKTLRHAWRTDGRIRRAATYALDAKAHFGAAVDACLLVIELGQAGVGQDAETFAGLDRRQPRGRFGLRGKDLVADVDDYDRLRRFEGFCPYQWRSGLKHDCAAVVELTPVAPDEFLNGFSQRLQLEREVAFPFLKATDLARGNIARPRRAVLVTQTHTGEDPARLASSAPLAWSYLQRHRAAFAARKSSIYRNRPEFSIFGVGAYTFAPFKVAVSGLHAEPAFALVCPVEDQPVLFDDTCYYLSFESESQALVVHGILNSEQPNVFYPPWCSRTRSVRSPSNFYNVWT